MSDRLFAFAVMLSLLVHAGLLAKETKWFEKEDARIVRIPLLLEENAPPPPPPPEPEEKKKPPRRKPKPQNLPDKIEKVVEGDGLRGGELVEADVGDYESGPPQAPPLAKAKPKIDRRKLTREFLKKVRDQLAANKQYPLVARRMGLKGQVKLSFVITQDGTFKKIVIKRKSGHDVLDRAALATVTGLSGQIKRPCVLGRNPLKTSVTLRYQLN